MFSAANGTPLVAHGIGTVRIATEFSEILVGEVYYAPDATANLVSGFMLRWSGYSIREGPDFTFQITTPNGELAAIASPINKVYVIRQSPRVVHMITTPDPLYLWHTRLGHAHYEIVSKITGIPIKPGHKFSPCYPCLAGKQTRNRSTEPQKRATEMLEFVHMDLGGYYVPSPNGFRYFLVIVDDFTRYIWI